VLSSLFLLVFVQQFVWAYKSDPKGYLIKILLGFHSVGQAQDRLGMGNEREQVVVVGYTQGYM